MTHGWVRSITKVDMGGRHDRTFLVTRSKVSLSAAGHKPWQSLVCWFDIPKINNVRLAGNSHLPIGVVPWSSASTNETESTVEIGEDQKSQFLTVLTCFFSLLFLLEVKRSTGRSSLGFVLIGSYGILYFLRLLLLSLSVSSALSFCTLGPLTSCAKCYMQKRT